MSDRLRPVRHHVMAEIPQDIPVRRGEYATVWLGEFDDAPHGRTQVELAVLPDGRRRICLPRGAPVEVLTFEEVYEAAPAAEGGRNG